MDMKRWLVWALIVALLAFTYSLIMAVGFAEVLSSNLVMILIGAVAMYFAIALDADEVANRHWLMWCVLTAFATGLYGWFILGSFTQLFTPWDLGVAAASAVIWYYLAPRIETILHA